MDNRSREFIAAEKQIDDVIERQNELSKQQSTNNAAWEKLYYDIFIVSRHYREYAEFKYRLEDFRDCLINVLYQNVKLNFAASKYDKSLDFTEALLGVIGNLPAADHEKLREELIVIQYQSQRNIETAKLTAIREKFIAEKYLAALTMSNEYLALHPLKKQQDDIYSEIMEIHDKCLLVLRERYYHRMNEYYQNQKYINAGEYAHKLQNLCKDDKGSREYFEAEKMTKACDEILDSHYEKMKRLYRERDFNGSIKAGSFLLSCYLNPMMNNERYDEIYQFVMKATADKMNQSPAERQYKNAPFLLLPPRAPSATRMTKSLTEKLKKGGKVKTRMAKSAVEDKEKSGHRKK